MCTANDISYYLVVYPVGYVKTIQYNLGSEDKRQYLFCHALLF